MRSNLLDCLVEYLTRPTRGLLHLLHLVAFTLDIHEHLRLAVRAHQDVEDLLPGPQTLRLQYRRRWNVDLHIRVGEIATDLRECAAVEEGVLARKQIRGGDEVLNGGDDGITVAWGDEVVLDAHKLESFGAGFLGLRDVKIHLIAVEVGIVGAADTLIESEGAPWSYFDSVTHNRELRR